MKHRGMKILSLLLSLVLALGLFPGMSLTAYAAGTLTIEISFNVKKEQSSTYYCRGTDQSIAEGTYVQFNMSTWQTATGHIYINNEEVYTWSGSSYKDNVYHFTAGKNCVIKGTPNFDSVRNPNIYITQDASVAVTGVTLNKESATLTVGDVQELTATVAPDDATDKSVTWSSDNTAVATVNTNGVVTAVAPGTATITATAANGTADTSDDKTASCTVTVNAATTTYTVTYAANNGSGDTQTYGPYEAGTTYTVETCTFTAPEGKVFDCWQGSDGRTYKFGDTATMTGNLTLTAQWKDKEEQGGGKQRTGGSGTGVDIVFNIPGVDNSWDYDGGYAPQRAWRVSLAPMANGSAALGIMSGESTNTDMNVYPTTTIYVFPNPDPGYALDKIVWTLIDGSASYDVTESRNFVMPAMDVVVYVTFKPAG